MSGASGGTAREGWPDVAKGLCIILVVLWHVVTKHAVEVSGAGTVTDAWATINAQLLPLRMPLFFLISGMFAGNAITRGSWAQRSGRLAAVYVIWVVIQTFALALTPDFDTARARTGWELLAQLTFSPTNLWYLLALAGYLALGRLCRGVPTAVLLPLAFVVSAAAATGILPDFGNLWQVFQNLFFFLAGLRHRELIERFAGGAGIVRMLVIGAVYLGAAGVVAVLGARQWPGVWTTLSALAVAAGIVLCVLVDRYLRALSQGLRWIGQRTLPIYVIHMIPLALLDAALRGAGWTAIPVMEAVGPVLMTAVVIATCLGVHALLLRARLAVLFDPFAPFGREPATKGRIR